jgi:hypothetical protein
MAQPQADRVWVAMAETSAGALVERVAEAGAECMDGDLEGQDGLKGFSVAGIHLRGASAGVKFLLQHRIRNRCHYTYKGNRWGYRGLRNLGG